MRPHARILYVITDLEVGGVPLHLAKLARETRRRGWEVGVVSLYPAGPVGRQMEDEGIEVLSCEGRHGADARVVTRLAGILRDRKPPLTHALLFHAGLAARLAAPLAGLRRDSIICEIQTAEVERRWHLAVDALTYSGCRTIICNSPSVRDHLAMAGIPDTHLTLICGGIDAGHVLSARPLPREQAGLPREIPLAVWVGRLDPVKGLANLLHAVARVPRMHLALVGDGPQRRALETLAEELSIAKRVHFLGIRRDVPSVLKTADLFVFPSQTEGLPNALLEAMAAGRPIVTTDVPGCRDLIQHESNGLVVPFGAIAELANAMARLIDDEPLARRLGETATATVIARWSQSRMFDEYESLYRRALAEQPPPA